jgi:hypothetical protein
MIATPLLCPSPVLWDQSFPRSENILAIVGKALGEIQLLLEKEQALLALTPMLQLFVNDFDFDRTGPYPLLTIIYNLMVQWCLQPGEVVRVIETGNIEFSPLHPLPEGCQHDQNSAIWAEELGKVLCVHDQNAENGAFYLGIACPYGFSGLPKSTYPPKDNAVRKFPIVAKDEIDQLADSFRWEIPAGLHTQLVSFKNACDHVKLLGGTVHHPSSGSHYTVTFPGAARPWVLDYNEDPLKDGFVKQLVPLTHYDFDVIKSVLVTGEFPARKFRLESLSL